MMLSGLYPGRLLTKKLYIGSSDTFFQEDFGFILFIFREALISYIPQGLWCLRVDHWKDRRNTRICGNCQNCARRCVGSGKAEYTCTTEAFSAPYYFVKFRLSVTAVVFPEILSSCNLVFFKHFVAINTPIAHANILLYHALQSQTYSFQISPEFGLV
jgi:hypothetical protein